MPAYVEINRDMQEVKDVGNTHNAGIVKDLGDTQMCFNTLNREVHVTQMSQTH